MHKKIITLSLAFLLLLSGFLCLAQNNTNSPYTRFGYGEIANFGSGKSKTMGGTSVGIRSENSINSANPASYTSIDSLTFIFEFGAEGRSSYLSTSQGTINSFNANFEFVTMQFPIKKWLAASVGLLPYSFVGYKIKQSDSIQLPSNAGSQTVQYEQTFSGSGSINQAYIGLSTKIGKHIALGVNTSYLFGSIQNSDRLSFLENTNYSVTLKNAILTVRDINFRYGLQYFTNISPNKLINIGLVFENKSYIRGNYSIEISGIDTISAPNSTNFETPLVLGGGISYEVKDKFLVGTDILFHNWSDANYFGVKDSLANQFKISLGGEYRHQINAKNYLQKITYRLGAFASNDYLNNNNNQPNYGITFGFGFPSKGNKSMVNIGFEYGKYGTLSNNHIREDYLKFTLNTNFNETWFFKRRFE